MPDPSFKVIKIHNNFEDDDRRPVQFSLGCHVVGTTCPMPDPDHGPSQLAGMTKRVAADMPPINQQTLRRFRRFVKRFCKSHLQELIIDPDEPFDFDAWIDNAPYTESRKQELRDTYYRINLDNKVKTEVKAFVKREFYEEPKHVRGIYSRSDEYKVEIGPFFKVFGDLLFKLEWFIKKISVNDRPQAILDRLEGFLKIFCTDFSQFESTFVRELLLIERMVYVFALQKHPLAKKIISLLDKLMDLNIIIFKKFTCQVIGKRMSGEMNTSCGNGLMNLLITIFVLLEAGNKLEEIAGFFEGDDSINKCANLPTEQQYRDLGANIKIDVPEDVSTASFCGNVFDPVALHNVTNPCEASVRFAWSDPKYMNAGAITKNKLLKSKALSMLHGYPGCPILRSLALYGLRVTKGTDLTVDFIKKNSVNSYEYEQQLEMMDYFKNIDKDDPKNVYNVKIHDNTRHLVERLYGITIDLQLKTEKYLDSLQTIQPLKLDLPFPTVWQVNDLEYSVMVQNKCGNICFVKKGYSTPYYTAPGILKVSHH
jgi:hypothetical protein